MIVAVQVLSIHAVCITAIDRDTIQYSYLITTFEINKSKFHLTIGNIITFFK